MMKFLAKLWSRHIRAQQPCRPVRRRARPTLEWLEDRSLPSAAHAPLADLVPPSPPAVAAAQPQVPFKESLTVVSVSGTGVVSYGGTKGDKRCREPISVPRVVYA